MTENLDIVCRLLDEARKLGADAADGMLFESVDCSASRRMRKPEGLERSESRAVGLRAFCGAGQAIVSSTDLGKDALTQLAERAVAMARVAPPDPDSTLAAKALHPEHIPNLDLEDKEEPGPHWLAEQCTLAEDAALSVKGITNSEGAEAHYSRNHVCLAASGKNTQFARQYATSQFSISASVLAGTGTGMERDYEFSATRYCSDLMAAGDIGISAANRALARLNPRKVKSCSVPVVFDPRVSKGLLGVLAGAISGSSIARGASFLKDSMGTAVFAKHVSIIDDPHIRRGLASKPFDAEGVKNQKRLIVENGVLSTWFLDIRTANRLKLTSTGHATRGIASAPSPSSTNLYMQKGTLSPKELMGDIQSGLYLTETFGMGVNMVTGDYSQGASGFWIEKGEIAYPVSEITIAGKLADMFKNATPANDLEFRYAINAPTIRVDAMTIAGV